MLSILLLYTTNMFQQQLFKNTVRWSAVLEVIVVKSLGRWIWDLLVARWSAQSSAYLTLMPPEGLLDFNVGSPVVTSL